LGTFYFLPLSVYFFDSI